MIIEPFLTYEQLLDKLVNDKDLIIAAVIYFETNTNLRIDWYYLEQEWAYSDNMEKLIKEPELESLWNGGKKIINR